MLKLQSETIKQEIKQALHQGLGTPISDIELEQHIEAMSKIEMMDKYLSITGEKITSTEICKAVEQIFGIDLDMVVVLDKGMAGALPVSATTFFDTPMKSQSRVAMDTYLEKHGNDLTGGEIRVMLNRIFGINLDGIAALGEKRISLFSKGQWVVRNEKDLFIVHTGTEDIDVKVLPTEYFTEHTGLDMLPEDLQKALVNLGFYYDEKIGSYYFCEANGHAVADKFKGQTLGEITEIIDKYFLFI